MNKTSTPTIGILNMDMLHRLSLKELTRAKMQIQTMIDLQQPKFIVGNIVTVNLNHPKVANKLFKITKINRVKVKLQDADGNNYKVAQRLLQFAPGATLKVS